MGEIRRPAPEPVPRRCASLLDGAYECCGCGVPSALAAEPAASLPTVPAPLLLCRLLALRRRDRQQLDDERIVAVPQFRNLHALPQHGGAGAVFAHVRVQVTCIQDACLCLVAYA